MSTTRKPITLTDAQDDWIKATELMRADIYDASQPYCSGYST